METVHTYLVLALASTFPFQVAVWVSDLPVSDGLEAILVTLNGRAMYVVIVICTCNTLR